MPRALITGVTGQDGAYLSQFLLEKGYEVFGLLRRSSSGEVLNERLRWLGIDGRVRMMDGNLIDLSSIIRILQEVKPDEVYNLGAQSFVKTSWNQPLLTGQVTALGATNLLEAMRLIGPRKLATTKPPRPKCTDGSRSRCRTRRRPSIPDPLCCCQALCALDDGELPREFRPARLKRHPVQPREPAARHRVCYAQGHGRRCPDQTGTGDDCTMGNMDAKRDWGHARDYVRAMWLMLQQDTPDDYVVATGRTVTVRDMARIAFNHVDLDYEEFVKVDPAFLRPAEVDVLLGDPSKAKAKLGWSATTTLEEMIREMVDADLFGTAPGCASAWHRLYGLSGPYPRGS